MNRQVVVSGIGVVASNGSNLEAFKNALMQGKSGIKYIEALEASGFGCHIGGLAEVPENELPEFFHDHSLQNTSNFVQLGTLAGVEAWRNAGFEIPKEGDEVDWDTGILLGTSMPGYDVIGGKLVPLTNEAKVRRIGGYAAVNAMGSAPSAFLSSILGTGNVTAGVSSACCSGTDAIVEAYHRIKNGRATRMLAGGSEGFSKYKWAPLDSMRVFNRQMNDRPLEASRPMSASACGFIGASGAGILVLEELESAKARGATILAEVLGGESNSGGQRNGGSLTFPNKEGIHRVLESSIAMAGINKNEIDLINGNLASTKADPIEVQGWKSIFNDADFFPKIQSTKSMTGHGFGATGGIESVACILQLQHDFIHPTLNCQDLHPQIAEIVPSTSIPHNTIMNAGVKTIIKANFGFGDVNSSVIYRKWD